ncbi:MAG: alpha/beta fold hydrolase [Actinomyces sp.]|nr:MAG: alpha/beta fold hydrolase [Actinomyces sp.]
MTRSDELFALGDAATTRVRAGGVELAVDRRGTGPPVLVLHGFTGSAGAMAPLCDRLTRGHHLVVPDLAGHGRSSVPSSPGEGSVAALAAQVLSVLDVFSLEAAHLVGYSMGGRVALTVAAAAPHRLRSLVTIGATGGITDPARRAERRRADAARADRLLAEGIEAFVDAWMALPLFAGEARLGPGHLRRARERRLAQRVEGLVAALRWAGTGTMAPLDEALARVSVPATFVAGAEDTRFVAEAERLAARVAHGRAVAVPDAGHAAHLERPDLVAEVVRSTIAGAEV